MKNKRPVLRIPYKLMLPNADAHSRAILTGAHIALSVNAMLAAFGLTPLFGIFISFSLAATEHFRHKLEAKESLQFTYSRIVLHFLFIIVLAMLATYLQVEQKLLWRILPFTLAPLSIYDAYMVFNGKHGYQFLTSIRRIGQRLTR